MMSVIKEKGMQSKWIMTSIQPPGWRWRGRSQWRWRWRRHQCCGWRSRRCCHLPPRKPLMPFKGQERRKLAGFYDGFNSALESNLIKEKTDLLLWILIPPSLFQCLQLPLVQQLQDPENCKRVLSVIKYIFPSWCWWLHAGICSSWSQAAEIIIIIIAIIMTILTYASLNWSLRGLPCWTARA